MPRADVVEIYELLRPKLGEEESKALLRFVEDRTIYLVRDEIAKGLATKEDIAAVKEDVAAVQDDIAAVKEDVAAVQDDVAAVKEDVAAVQDDIAALERNTRENIAELERNTREDIARLERNILTFEWRTRLYLVAIGVLIIITNSRVLDLLGKLLGITP